MIFEKAWAKLHLSYEATAGGQTEDAASYLSAGVCVCIYIIHIYMYIHIYICVHT